MAQFSMKITRQPGSLLGGNQHHPGKKVIIYDKERAGGEVEAGPFALGGRGARTVPRAWELADAATECLRPLAPPNLKNRLLLAMSLREDSFASGGVQPVGSQRYRIGIGAHLDDIVEGRWELLRSVRQNLTSLALIRTTAINVARSRLGSARETAMVTRHQGTGSLDSSYLNNPHYKAELDEQIAESQRLMVRWVKTGLTVVPNSVESLVREHDIDPQTAEEITSDRENLGFGVSLTKDGAFVLDTPLNCMRMIQFVRKIEAAKNILISENPVRWQYHWAPQLYVLKAALNDFPRATKAEAEKMDRSYELRFPEIR